MREELKEWLGIKPTDFVVYAAGAAIVWMYFNRSTALDVVLSVAAVALCLLACFMGMRPDTRLSGGLEMGSVLFSCISLKRLFK